MKISLIEHEMQDFIIPVMILNYVDHSWHIKLNPLLEVTDKLQPSRHTDMIYRILYA